ncbi:MAG: leucine-rich repeat protein [Bacteroidaceae bacterium]|nr:leucine-rich repeat protein [Bacteroidaceae bacterium]
MKHTRHWLTMVVWLLCSITASAETVASGTCGDNLTWTLTDEGELIIEGTGAMEDYWTGDAPWWEYVSLIKSISINNGITSIGNCAFVDCCNLTDISIPNSVTSIGYEAFYGCYNLVSISIPEGVTSIGELAFLDCESLTSITIPASVTAIDNMPLVHCDNLESIVVATSNTVYDSRNNCNAIIKTSTNTLIAGCSCTVIPNTVTSIGDYAFFGVGKPTSISISESVTSIGEEAFGDCANLTSIMCRATVPPICDATSFDYVNKSIPVFVPESSFAAYQAANVWKDFTNIRFYIASGTCGDNLTWMLTDEGELIIEGTGSMRDFTLENLPWKDDLSSITSITIKQGVASIGSYAFSGCHNLISVIVPESIVSIGAYAFNDCEGLTSIIIPEGVVAIGENIFRGCTSLVSIMCKAITPPTCDETSFTSVDKSIPVFVPTSSVAAYQAANVWEDFTNIHSLIASGSCGDRLTWTLTDDGRLIIEGSGVMPNYYFGDNAPWNDYRYSIKDVVMREGVTSVGAGNFRGCDNLVSITIPNSVTSIGYEAFYGCSSLASITIPEGVTSIGDNRTFFGCSSLTTITIPNGVTEIGYSTFTNCTNLVSITIPQSITKIGEFAFSSCSSLTSITIPESVTNIGKSAFNNCSSLTSIIIPQSVTRIEGRAFLGCNSLISIVVEEGNAIYDSRDGCNAIIETSTNTLIEGCNATVIPNSVMWIGDNAFSGNSLTSLIIPEGVVSIGSNAFWSCKNLTSITIPKSLNYINHFAFSGCNSLTSITIPKSQKGVGNYTFSGCSSLSSIVIPKEVVSIGNSAFARCSSLTSITIPESVTNIYGYAFYNCTGLASIISKATTPPVCSDSTSFGFVDKSIPVYVPASSVAAYQAADGWSEFSNIRSLIASGTCGENLTWTLTDEGELIIEGTGAMDDYDLENNTAPWYDYNSSIKNVTLKNGVTSIGASAFSLCSLTTITIPEGVTSIGNLAFDRCSLTSITIPASVTSIGRAAFYACSKNLTSIVVAEENTVYDSREGCNAIIKTSTNTLIVGCSTTLIPNDVTGIGDWAFDDCSSLTSITIPEGVTSIGYAAFKECHNLTSITIPASVTSIGNSAFGNCHSLTSITIPASVTSIETYAFAQCSNLTSMEVAEENTVYDSRNGCNAIIETSTNTLIAGCSSTVIPESVTSISNTAFMGCYFTTITIPNSVTSIGYWAFWSCPGLTSITIPESVTSIGNQAFAYCYNLISVTVGSTVPVALTDGDVFSNRANATLYVPAGSKEAYANAAVWSEFKEIVEVGNAFVVDDATLRAGRSALLPVALTNEDEITAFQCDIYLPEGITLLTTNKGKYDITLAEERKDDHTVTSSLQNDGAIRVVVASLTSSLFAGNSGDLFYLNLQADEDISGELPLSIKNIRISESDGTRHDLNDASCVINVPAFTPADANNDGLVAIDDVVLTINYLLGDVSDNFLFVAGDMNADNQILIDDVVQIINCLLGVSTADVQDARNRMHETGETLTAGDTQCGFDVKLSNASNYVALQCDVLLPAGVGIDDVRVTSGGDHSVVFREMGDGLVRIAVTSLTNEAFASDNLLDVAVSADSQADIHITNAYAVTRGGVMVKAADASLTHGTTGIQPAGMEAISTEIYDLNGRVVKENATSTEDLQKGIYLMNGKKVVVK